MSSELARPAETEPRRRGTYVRRVFILAGLLLSAILVLQVYRHHVSDKRYKGRSLEMLCIQASSGDTNAISVLKDLGPGIVPDLKRVLKARDSAVRVGIVQLGQRLPKHLGWAATKLAGRLPAAQHRQAAAKCLGLLGADGQPAVEALLQALHDPDPQVRWEAATALARIGKPSTDGLTKMLGDPNPAVRQAAAFALGEMRDAAEGAIPTLIERLADTNADVRASSFYSLSMIGFPSMLALSNVVAQGDAKARETAVRTVIRFRRALHDVVPGLIQMSQAETVPARCQALEALGTLRFGDDASMKALVRGMQDPAAQVRLAATKALNQIIWRAEMAMPQLITGLHDDSAEVREWSINILGNIGPRAAAAIPELERIAAELDNPLSDTATRALNKIRSAKPASS